MQNPFPVDHSPHVCVIKKMKHTDLCYFHMQLTWLDWSRSRSRSRSRSFWSRSHNRFLVSVSVLISLCSGLINKPAAAAAAAAADDDDDDDVLKVSKPLAATRSSYLFIIINGQLSAYSLVTGQKLLRLDYSNSLHSDGKTRSISAASPTHLDWLHLIRLRLALVSALYLWMLEYFYFYLM